jgi:tetratricopeptide (TPR) repeat protein
VNESQVFTDALKFASPAERAAYLDRACAGNQQLRAGVEALLRARASDPDFLEQPPGPVTDTADVQAAAGSAAMTREPVATDQPGIVLSGRYKLLEQIGEGGMGTVWMAQQTEPVKRHVAVKLIKDGMGSKSVLARFEAERQALALMDHPNIAKVFDAGAAPDGRPFFVMELVKGVPITKYCDEHRLTPRQRLELFLPVCHAVQHAHQKGVIHRDLKPSNVLVALYDGKPVPKVIDFGVAKATGQQLTEESLHTSFGAVVGTVEYMSPEQATFNQLDVDTRSDIYSLGVLLYELLTGTTPLDRKRLKETPLLELLRIVREDDTVRPSTRLSTVEELPSIAAQRGVEPKKLSGLVRGELDWIVMRALEKDRTRRYETANGFAMDVQRYLADEPVQACPPSLGYRLRKFVRRNKGPVLAASLVLLALVGGIVGTTVGLVRAEQAKGTAEKRLAQIEKGIDLLGFLFEDLDPLAEEKEGRPLRAILGDRLDQAAAALEGEAVGDPLVVARLQDRLGQTYLGLGHAARAEALFTKAVTTRQAHLGADDPLTLGSMHNQALAYEAAGKRNEAIKRFEQVHDARVKVLGADHLDTLTTRNDLAAAYWMAGKPTEAIPLLEQVRDGRVKQLGEDHDHTLATLSDLAGAYLAAGRWTEAITLAEQVLDARVKKHGDDHPHAIDALSSLAYAYQSRGGKMKQALALFEQARDTTVPKLGPYHPLTLSILHYLAHMYRVYRRTPEAIALLEQVRERRVMILGGHHPATLVTLHELAWAYRDAGELDKALSLSQQAAAGVERLKFAHSYADVIVQALSLCHEHLKQYDQAEVWRRKWLAVVKEKDGPESAAYAAELTGLGSNLLQQKRHADAESLLRVSLTILQNKQPEARETFLTPSMPGAPPRPRDPGAGGRIWEASYTRSLLGTALLGQQGMPRPSRCSCKAIRGCTSGRRTWGTSTTA